MCERCQSTDRPSLLGRGGRRKLWTIPGEFHCSIVGTCLSADDIAWLCRRLRLVPSADARPYDIHRFFVEKAAEGGAESRLMHRRLDENFAGAIRRFGRESTEAGWLGLWDAAVASGGVAPAYWAVLSLAAVPETVRARAFADVHMLSHIMGGANRRHLRETQDLARRCAEAEERLARHERSSAERIAEKDARIRALEAQMAERAARAQPVRVVAEPPPRRTDRALREVDALRRRVAAERARARRAEADLDRLRGLLDGAALRGTPDAAPAEPGSAEPAASGLPADLGGQSILYVGGRLATLRSLRSAVEARNGCLLHHDGGMEQTVRGLAGLVERADLVVCPIDCVSHDACLRVKGLCRRMGKPFVPMRSAGATSFARTLGAFSGGAGDGVSTAPTGARQ